MDDATMATANSQTSVPTMTRVGPSLDVVRAIVGGVFCVLFVTWANPRPVDAAWAEGLLLLCPLAIIPLTLVILLKSAPDAARSTWKLIEQYELSAATMLIGPYIMAPSRSTAVLTLPWFVLTLMFGWAGLFGLARRNYRDLVTTATDLACLSVAVGGLLTVVERTGGQPFGVEASTWILLALHFYYSGFLLLLCAAWGARESGSTPLAKAACLGVMLGVPLMAAGILAGRLHGYSAVEAAAVAFMVVAGWLVATLLVRLAMRGETSKPVRALWSMAAAALVLSFALVLVNALRSLIPALADVPDLRALHGPLHVFGFGLCGISGWRLQRSGQVRGEAE